MLVPPLSVSDTGSQPRRRRATNADPEPHPKRSPRVSEQPEADS
jgi:hypothetical protein